MHLGKLEPVVYSSFIRSHLASHNREITDEAIAYIFDKTDLQTYYAQLWLNFIFAEGATEIDLDICRMSLVQLLEREEQQYYQLRKLLPNQQWKVLVAIALEGEVNGPTSKAFISKYALGAASSTRQALLRLEELGLIQSEFKDIKEKPFYAMDDAFLKEWLNWKYG